MFEKNRALTTWLLVITVLIGFLVVFGGYVRLTRSGLSIVEWNPISGVIPPLGDAAWQTEFAKYQQTPEYQLVNKGMTLAEYKEIFYLEWFHRLIARLAGLLVVIPLFTFLLKGVIPWRRSLPYLAIGLLFAFQGFLGWFMVASGLVDRPAVSHFRLTIHLLTALLLLGLTFWTWLNHRYGFPEKRAPGSYGGLHRLAWWTLAVLLFQISYGGLVAGLKAGHVSNRWPLMNGRWIPAGLLSTVEPWWENFFAAPLTVHFVHRWFAFAVLTMAGIFYLAARRQGASPTLQNSALALLGLISVQILLGISVIWFGVPIWLALLHQATAILLYVVTLFLIYQLRHQLAPVPAQARAPRFQAEMA